MLIEQLLTHRKVKHFTPLALKRSGRTDGKLERDRGQKPESSCLCSATFLPLAVLSPGFEGFLILRGHTQDTGFKGFGNPEACLGAQFLQERLDRWDDSLGLGLHQTAEGAGEKEVI